MIDYLEDLLEEEGAVELTGALLVPVGRRTIPLWEEDEDPLRWGRTLAERTGGGQLTAEEEGSPVRAGRASWGEERARAGTGAVWLLERLARAGQAVGAIRQQEESVPVTLAGETPQGRVSDLETLDRAVQRDARRYDGGFPLY